MKTNPIPLFLTLLLAQLAASHTANTPEPPVKVTQQLLNAIHTHPVDC